MSARNILRHYLAALAYRLQTAVRGAPATFGEFDAGNGVRSPAAIVRHMTHVLGYAHRRFAPETDVGPPTELPFAEEIARFHEALAVVDRDLVEQLDEVDEDVVLRLLQGPLADAMTHVGQLAMLRRMAGSPIPGQSFSAADVAIGRVGPDQKAP